MGTFWKKTAVVISGILSAIGLSGQNSQANFVAIENIEQINKSTPLYLQQGVDVFKINAQKVGDMLSWHYSHSSHSSHSSHYSHRSGF